MQIQAVALASVAAFLQLFDVLLHRIEPFSALFVELVYEHCVAGSQVSDRERQE
jgi:hypothetical protein